MSVVGLDLRFATAKTKRTIPCSTCVVSLYLIFRFPKARMSMSSFVWFPCSFSGLPHQFGSDRPVDSSSTYYLSKSSINSERARWSERDTTTGVLCTASALHQVVHTKRSRQSKLSTPAAGWSGKDGCGSGVAIRVDLPHGGDGVPRQSSL